METTDFRIIAARRFLKTRRRPDELTPDELVTENAELRRLLGWAVDVADDWAATELDENVTQVTLWGGLYIAPADVARSGKIPVQHRLLGV